MSAETDFAEATTFAIESIKLAIIRLGTQIERLEQAFIELHPLLVLPEIPFTDEELEFFERYKDLIDK